MTIITRYAFANGSSLFAFKKVPKPELAPAIKNTKEPNSALALAVASGNNVTQRVK